MTDVYQEKPYARRTIKATRPKIILANAFPKSGITWLIHQLCWLFKAEQGGVELGKNIRWLKGTGKDWEVHKGHYQSFEIPEYVDYVAMITRHPGDIIVSKWHYNGGISNIQRCVDVVCRDWADWHNGWLEYAGIMQEVPVIFTKFEGLKFSQRGNLNEIYEHISGGLPNYDLVTEAIEENSIDKLRDITGDTHFFRKGIVGDYKFYLDDAHIKQIKDKLGDTMRQFGYEV